MEGSSRSSPRLETRETVRRGSPNASRRTLFDGAARCSMAETTPLRRPPAHWWTLPTAKPRPGTFQCDRAWTRLQAVVRNEPPFDCAARSLHIPVRPSRPRHIAARSPRPVLVCAHKRIEGPALNDLPEGSIENSCPAPGSLFSDVGGDAVNIEARVRSLVCPAPLRTSRAVDWGAPRFSPFTELRALGISAQDFLAPRSQPRAPPPSSAFPTSPGAGRTSSPKQAEVGARSPSCRAATLKRVTISASLLASRAQPSWSVPTATPMAPAEPMYSPRPPNGWRQAAELTDTGFSPSAGFGSSVAVFGGTVVAGAPLDDVFSGGAEVFQASRNRRRQVTRLTGRDTSVRDFFGFSIGICGGNVAGYVVALGDSGWRQDAVLKCRGTVTGDEFGDSVAISGATIVIGARLWGMGAGEAYMFGWDGGAWHQAAAMTGLGTKAGDAFGRISIIRRPITKPRTDCALRFLRVANNPVEANGALLRYMAARSWPRSDLDFLTTTPIFSSWPRPNPWREAPGRRKEPSTGRQDDFHLISCVGGGTSRVTPLPPGDSSSVPSYGYQRRDQHYQPPAANPDRRSRRHRRALPHRYLPREPSLSPGSYASDTFRYVADEDAAALAGLLRELLPRGDATSRRAGP
jgi:hypothetical protein